MVPKPNNKPAKRTMHPDMQ